MSLGFLAVALIGFSTTLFLPLARGTFVAPPVIYLHGALVFSWLIFFIAQALLIRVRNVSVHRRLGWFGALLGIAVVISGVAVSFHVVRRELAAGGGDVVLREFVARGLPPHREDLLLRTHVALRVPMAFQAPLHLQRAVLPGERHAIDAAVTCGAAHALVHVDAVVEVNEVRQIVNLDPFDWLAGG
jgi:6,7-dimethyl-8-ribityllumazine synthase